MNQNSRNGHGVAVITGAAGGFGQCFAQRMAERGHDLLLVDVRADGLELLCERIRRQCGVKVEIAAYDLTERQALQTLRSQLNELQVVCLINNAGFAHLKSFVEIGMEDHKRMADLHIHAPMVLTRAVLPQMIERRSGSIVNVSSLGAWLPSGDAQYAATKAYLLVLSQALQEEVGKFGIRVQALCPSFVDTGFHNTEEMKRFPRNAIPRAMWMSADKVVDCSLRCLALNRVVVIPGWRNRIVSLALRSPFLQPLICRWVRRKEQDQSENGSALQGVDSVNSPRVA